MRKCEKWLPTFQIQIKIPNKIKRNLKSKKNSETHECVAGDVMQQR